MTCFRRNDTLLTMERWVQIGIPAAIIVAAEISFARGGFDPEHPNFWYCLLMVTLLVSSRSRS
jgi:hypothetical protein